jgi:hypothetical protein
LGRRSLPDCAEAALHRFRILHSVETFVVMCCVCGAQPCINPGFCKACRSADQQARGKPLRLIAQRSDGAAESTVEALIFGLREGIASLATHPERQRRLSDLSRKQLSELCDRIQKFMPHIAPAWTPDEVQALVNIWGRIRA